MASAPDGNAAPALLATPAGLTRVPAPKPRKGMPSPRLNEAEFRTRFLSQFQDSTFDSLRDELARVAGAAWDAYSNHRKAPRTRKAGSEFHDPNYELAIDWLTARAAIAAAP